jgi:hypothetical protein
VKLTRRKSFLINLALMVGSSLCFLGGLEAVGWCSERKYAQGPYAWELVASRRIRLDRFETSSTGYTLMHPGDEYNWQGIPVRINSQGLRGPEVDLEKPPDTYRVLNLGDSVVFGWGARYDDTYGCQLQELLNQRYGSEAVTYEIINAGVPRWNTQNVLAYLEAEGLDYQPDLILLNFTTVNDVYGGSGLEASSEPLLDWLRDHTYSWPFLSVQYHLLEARLGQRDAIPVLNPPADATAYFPTREDDPQWDVVWEPIRDMAALAGEHGSEFLLIVLPTAFQVQDVAYSDVPQQVLGMHGREDRVEVLDLLPVFREACQEASPRESCGAEGRYLWADMWMHPSALGHRLVAERLLEVLEERGWH